MRPPMDLPPAMSGRSGASAAAAMTAARTAGISFFAGSGRLLPAVMYSNS
jgi:hypothetical protein